ncbi:MAG: heparinase II/III-family protein, partial [Deltaproteobacteria bacterium]|nr:heparinase II/III-family protein [Deltaproteobacteria bacterium]
GCAEQSTAYHRFVLDLYWLALHFLKGNALIPSSRWKERLEAGEKFLAAFAFGGATPSIGDSDDGCVVGPGLYPPRGRGKALRRETRTFPEAGYTIIPIDKDGLLTFDHGPLGMPPLFNHGHADALSITLTKSGKPLLVDPGTYKYNQELEFRRYFKGTRAHNTVTIDGEDQAVQETSFIWSKPYKARLEGACKANGDTIFVASHSGYLRLKDPVVHRRLVMHFRKSNLLIKDCFEGRGIHSYELNFHIHPDGSVERRGAWWRISNGDVTIHVRLFSGGDFEVREGAESPILGWYSPRYGVKVPSKVLNAIRRGFPKDTIFLTGICLDDPFCFESLLSGTLERLSSVAATIRNS